MLIRTCCLLTFIVVVAGCSGSDDSTSGPPPGSNPSPTCATPVSLSPAEAKGPRFIVMLRKDGAAANTAARVDALEAKYGFSASSVYESFGGFAAKLEPAQLSGLRCDAEVESVSEDALHSTQG